MLLTHAREYKIELGVPVEAPELIWRDVQAAAAALGLWAWGGFSDATEGVLEGFDTADFALRHGGLRLRRRSFSEGQVQLALRARSEDRYIAARSRVLPIRGCASRSSFLEEIRPPFRVRYAHACVLDVAAGRNRAVLERVGLARLFPLVRRVCDGEPLVQGQLLHQRVLTGAGLALAPRPDTRWVATVALRVLTRPEGAARAVLTFRYGDRRERYPLDVCQLARRLFDRLQAMPWVAPGHGAQDSGG